MVGIIPNYISVYLCKIVNRLWQLVTRHWGDILAEKENIEITETLFAGHAERILAAHVPHQ